MSKVRLFITEKPKISRIIAEYLQKENNVNIVSYTDPDGRCGYFICDNDIITWAFGHLFRITAPEFNNKNSSFDSLPIIPKKWTLEANYTRTGYNIRQINIIDNLAKRENVDIIIHAGDNDREGQRIVDDILEYINNTKPVKRMVLTALNFSGIRSSLEDLKDNKDFKSISDSAAARRYADYLFGINLSRAYKKVFDIDGEISQIQGETARVGRVQTPTLALVVDREKTIINFKPIDYYDIEINVKYKNNVLRAIWKPNKKDQDIDEKGRCLNREKAEKILKEIEASPFGIVNKLKIKEGENSAPAPYSLSALQIYADILYNYDPSAVLDTIESIYLDGLSTYPRTDSRSYPEAYWDDRYNVFDALKAIPKEDIKKWCKNADLSIKSRAWDANTVKTHSALMPTADTEKWSKLNEFEKNIYSMIIRAYVGQFYPLFKYIDFNLNLKFNKEQFIIIDRDIVDLGWLEIYPMNVEEKTKKKATGYDENLRLIANNLNKGDEFEYVSGRIINKTTVPPLRFTEGRLIKEMEFIYKRVEDKENQKILRKTKGIGTEATRTKIIGRLLHPANKLNKPYLIKDNKTRYLSPTTAGFNLFNAVNKYSEIANDPIVTAEWEKKLEEIANGEKTADAFYNEQVEFLKKIINEINSKMKAKRF